MKNGDPISIEKTANGWLVRPQFERDSLRCLMWGEVHVFQKVEGLASFVAKHYAKETK